MRVLRHFCLEKLMNTAHSYFYLAVNSHPVHVEPVETRLQYDVCRIAPRALRDTSNAFRQAQRERRLVVHAQVASQEISRCARDDFALAPQAQNQLNHRLRRL
jgi:hypothetical protein